MRPHAGHRARQPEALQPMRLHPLARLAPGALAALALSGCPSLTQREGLPPSIDRAEQLEKAGDAVGAARVYEALAAQNSGSDRNDYLLRAAGDYLSAHHADDAARVLALTEPPLSPAQASE